MALWKREMDELRGLMLKEAEKDLALPPKCPLLTVKFLI